MHRISLFLALCAFFLSLIAPAATTYENYTFTTIAGRSEPGNGWFDGALTNSRFNFPFALSVDGNGNIFVADTANHTIRTIAAGVVSTVAGSAGVSGSADGTGRTARFDYPEGIALDKSDNVYVADTVNHTIRMITPAGVVTTVAGSPGNQGSTNSTGGAARFYYPVGVAVDTNGNVFVAEYGNDTLRKI